MRIGSSAVANLRRSSRSYSAKSRLWRFAYQRESRVAADPRGATTAPGEAFFTTSEIVATDDFWMSSMVAMTQAGCWYESMSSATRSGGLEFGVGGIEEYGNDHTLAPGRA